MNRALSIATAAFFAFITAAIFVVLFITGLLSAVTVIAITGIIVSAVVIALLFLSLAWCSDRSCRNGINNAIGCFGRPVVFAAVISLGLSLILAGVFPAGTTAVLGGILFAQIFLLIFTVFMFAFLIALAMPTGCNITGSTAGYERNCCSCCCTFEDD